MGKTVKQKYFLWVTVLISKCRHIYWVKFSFLSKNMFLIIVLENGLKKIVISKKFVFYKNLFSKNILEIFVEKPFLGKKVF